MWNSVDLRMFGKPLPPLLEHPGAEMGFGLSSVGSPGVPQEWPCVDKVLSLGARRWTDSS